MAHAAHEVSQRYSPQATTAPGQEDSKVSETDHPALDTTAADQRDTF
jgi:hypothetical protein